MPRRLRQALKPAPAIHQRWITPPTSAAASVLKHGCAAVIRFGIATGGGFVFYTQAGAGLARAADALQPEIAQACASTTPPEPRRR